MQVVKSFLDDSGTSYLWSKIKAQLNLKAALSDLEDLQTRVSQLDESTSSSDTALSNRVSTLETDIQTKATQTGLNTVDGKVDTLIGEDVNMSSRQIAATEVAKIVADADVNFDTLKEIADWIATHNNSATAMNTAITALQNKLTLGTFLDQGQQKEYATVKAYVEAAIADLERDSHTHNNKAVLDGIDSTKVSNWDSAASQKHTHSNMSILSAISQNDIDTWNYIGASDSTPNTLRSRVVFLEDAYENRDIFVPITDAEIDDIVDLVSEEENEENP